MARGAHSEAAVISKPRVEDSDWALLGVICSWASQPPELDKINAFLLFNQPVCGILLLPPAWANRIFSSSAFPQMFPLWCTTSVSTVRAHGAGRRPEQCEWCPMDHVSLDYEKKSHFLNQIQRCLGWLKVSVKSLLGFLQTSRSLGHWLRTLCGRERWFRPQFQVGPDSRPGHRGRTLIWMK